MTGSLAAALAGVAVLAPLMVGAMVRFSRAAIEWSPGGAPREAEGDRRLSPLARWGALYALSWFALIAAFLYLFSVTGEGFTPRNLGLLGAVVGGYLAVNALLILFARALIRANRRGAAGEADGGWRAEEDGSAEDGEASAALSPRPEPAAGASPWARARRVLGSVAFVAGVLLVIGVAEAVPALVRLGEWLDARRGPLLLATGILAGVGFVLFMGAVLHLVLTGGTPMSRTEETFTLSEVKAAWRARAWRVSPTWRRRFTFVVGAGLLTLGLMGVALALSPVGLKLLIAAVLLYAAVRTLAGFVRS